MVCTKDELGSHFFCFHQQSTLSQWRIVFWVCFAFLIITNIIFCIWMDGKQQWWDDIRQHSYPPGWKEKHGSLLKEEINGGEAVKINR